MRTYRAASRYQMTAGLNPHNIISISLWLGILETEHISALVDEERAHLKPKMTIIANRFNRESLLFVGRVIATSAAESNISHSVENGKLRLS